ncbi:MAG: SDR family NAD(P)-dependent oxidoreductase [Massilia sp.]
MQKCWFITGASRGLGANIARAALAAGDRVVATGRDPEAVRAALGAEHERLAILPLDVAHAAQAEAAVGGALARFGGIDVLVNNAGFGQVGFFEESSEDDMRAQFDSNLFGMMHVTRAVLPGMRAARAGRIINLSSLAGLHGAMFSTLYSASKFAVEGFSEALAEEMATFGIRVTIVAPGPFRTDFLTSRSLRVGALTLPDYDAMRQKILAGFAARDGRQTGDPVKLAQAIVALANDPAPPLRFVAGTPALDAALQSLARKQEEIASRRAQSVDTDGDYADVQEWELPASSVKG